MMRLAPKQALLIEYMLVVSILVPIVLTACALVITYDLHVARVEFAASNAELRRETFRRVDSLLWKADTGLEIASAMRFDLGNMITKLRAQVKQSSDESTKAATIQAKAATVAVTAAIDKTAVAIQSATGDMPEDNAPPELEKQPITVNVPAPVVVAPVESAESPKVEPTVAKKHRHWFTYIWRWW